MESNNRNKESKHISNAVIRRLPRYYRYLGELINEGYERISSKDLSIRMHVTASQIRQDLNNFGGFGQQGYGYNVRYLHGEIGKILGLDETHNIVIVGIGNIGHALAGYLMPDRNGFHLCGLFDSDPDKVGKVVAGLTVHSIEELPAFIRDNHVEIATLAVPGSAAREVADLVVRNGVKSIWNFALIDLNLCVPKGVIVENVHLLESLMRLSHDSKKKNEK